MMSTSFNSNERDRRKALAEKWKKQLETDLNERLSNAKGWTKRLPPTATPKATMFESFELKGAKKQFWRKLVDKLLGWII